MLRMFAAASVSDVPLNSALTEPPLVTLPLTMPMPAPMLRASEYASTCESPNERAMTFSVPVCVIWVADPTAARTVGELIAVATAPLTAAMRPAPPSEARAKAGATTVGAASPMSVL